MADERDCARRSERRADIYADRLRDSAAFRAD